jgi:DNA-binding transcriptional regulator PaaX
MVQFTPRFIVITSPRLPEEIYCPTAQGDSINQLLRRIDKTIEKK